MIRPAISLVLLVSLAALVACGPRPAREEPATHRRGPNSSVILTGPSVAYVQVQPAAAATEANTRSLVARVAFDERHLATIGPPVQGRVATVNVITGDHVEAGQVLATIHAPDIAAANAQVTEAHAATQLALRAMERARVLVAQGAGSAAEQQQATAGLAQAQSEEQRASAVRVALGGAAGAADYALRSPIAGTVVSRSISVGAEVHADQDAPLMTVADLSTVWVVADVFEQDLPFVHAGDAATVSVPAFPGRSWLGRITFVGDTLDATSRTAHARIELVNPEQALRSGMYARVVVSGQAEGDAEVPVGAILARRDQFFVFVRNADGSFVQREVHPGEQHGGLVTILTGLHPGEAVATRGAILLDSEANESF